MNKPDTEIKRWGVVVIQSLCEKDLKTGEQIYHDVLQYKNIQQREAFASIYIVNSIPEFEDAINEIVFSIDEGDIITLQIETHGSVDGIVLNNGEIITWSRFYDLVRQINVRIGHLLLLVMAMSKSISMISSINPVERAPYRAFICTTRDVSGDEIYNAFSSFYQKYYNLLDIAEAMSKLQNEVIDENGLSPFQLLTADSVFDETFTHPRNLETLAATQLFREGKCISPQSVSQKAKDIQAFLKATHDKFYNYYNFRDIY